MSNETQVKVGKHTITIGIPTSMTDRYDAVLYFHSNVLRCYAACLGMAWQALPANPHPPKIHFNNSKVRRDVGTYGGFVADELIARGVPLDSIFESGAVAYNAFLETLPRESEVAATEATFPEGES